MPTLFMTMAINSVLLVIPGHLLPQPVLMLPFDPCKGSPSKVVQNDWQREGSLKLLVQSTESLKMELDCPSTITTKTEGQLVAN